MNHSKKLLLARTPSLSCNYSVKIGGRRGIRTPGTVTRTPDFESGALDQLSHPSRQ